MGGDPNLVCDAPVACPRWMQGRCQRASCSQPSLAPPWSRQLRSDSLEEVRALIGNRDGRTRAWRSLTSHWAMRCSRWVHPMRTWAAPSRRAAARSCTCMVGCCTWRCRRARCCAAAFGTPPDRSEDRGADPARMGGDAHQSAGCAVCGGSRPHALMAELQARRPDEVRRNLGASRCRNWPRTSEAGCWLPPPNWCRRLHLASMVANRPRGGPVHRAHGRPGAARRR